MIALALLVALAPQAPKPIAELDFEMVGNRIYLPAKLNGRNTPAIFDTGAGASAVDLALANELKIPGDQPVQAGGVGAARVMGRILTGAGLEIGGQNHSVSYAIPFGSLSVAEGRKLELILGYDFISKYVFEIDYAGKKFRIHASGTQLLNPGTEIPVRFLNGHPHIRTRITLGGQTHDVEAMIDSGASGGGLTGRFTKAVPIPASVRTTASTIIGGGVGGFVNGRFLRLDKVDLGGLVVKGPVASVNEGSGGANGSSAAYDYLIGAEILKRFTLTLDYPSKRIFLRANSDFEKPFEADKTGLRLQASGANLREVVIVGILPGSSAEEAGLKGGDKVISIDGISAQLKTLQDWRDFLRSVPAKSWSFEVDRKGEKLRVKVAAREVI